jgi:hypothetical protein
MTDIQVTGDPVVDADLFSPGRSVRSTTHPVRSAPFDFEPGFYEPAGLWLYGNVKLLKSRIGYVAETVVTDAECDFPELERTAEDIVLGGEVLVCGVHNPAHRRVATVPLRWGAPRILVFSGGFKHHLGEDLDREPFHAARLWRYRWDPQTDLAISRRAPDKRPTFASRNPTIERLIAYIADQERRRPTVADPLALCPQQMR